MAKVTEPKNFVELQAKYTARLAEVSAEFRLALASSKPATIADRIRRSAMTTSCLYDGAADAARLMYGGQPNNSYDIATQLYSTLQREIKKYFDERPPAGTKSDGKTFPDVEAVQAAAAELRRVTAEAAVTFQTLESQPHITLDGGCIREQVVRLAAKSVKWAALTSALPKVILDTLLLHRKSPAYASWQDHRMLAMAREALKMLVSLTLPDARESMLQAQVVKPYLQQLQTCFKGKFTVKQILEIGKTTMKSEIVMAEFTFASFIPKIGETVKSELQKLLLVDNAKRIAEDREYGAMATLLKPLVHADEFAALVTLLDFDEGAVQCIDEAVMVAVAEAVTALLAKPKYAENFINAVPSLIKLAAEYRLTVSVQHTTNDLRHRFCVSVQAGVMSALDDNGSFEEAFVNIIDGVLKEKRATPDTRGERLMALLDGLSLIRDPALFVAFYKRQLATRLLLRPYVSLTLEKTTLDGIESRLGYTVLRHLRVMLNEVNKASASPSPANGGPSDAVWCSEYVWPTGDLNRMLLPPAISALCQDALQRQSAVPQYARHVFTIDPTLTVVELKYRPRKDGHTCLVRCCAAQAAVLMTVAAAGSQGIDVDAIARALTCSVNSVLFILKSITGGLLMVNDVSGRCVIQEGYMDGATQDHKLALPSLVSAKRRPTITTTHVDPAANDLSPPTSDGSAGGWFQQIARIRELLRLRRSQQ